MPVVSSRQWGKMAWSRSHPGAPGAVPADVAKEFMDATPEKKRKEFARATSRRTRKRRYGRLARAMK